MSENKRIKLSDLQGKCTIFKFKIYGTNQTLIGRLENITKKIILENLMLEVLILLQIKQQLIYQRTFLDLRGLMMFLSHI